MSNVVARMVTFEAESPKLLFDDNFFDLMPNAPQTIGIKHLEDQAIPWETLTVTAINSHRVLVK